MKRDRRSYNAGYFKTRRSELLQSMRQRYQAKLERVSADFLRHLQAHPMHALGRPESICPECERMGPIKPAVCVEDGCGRMGLRQLAAHVGAIHHLSIEAYKEKWAYDPREHMTSPAFHEERSKLSSTTETLERLKPFHFPSTRAKSSHENAAPSQYQVTLPYWPIAARCLKGRERRQVATQLDMWAGTVNRCCVAMRFPSRPTRFWRGEPVSDRQLHDVMRDFNLSSEVKVADLTKLPVHRIRRALAKKRKGKPLQIDVANRVLQLRHRLHEEKRHNRAAPIGGRPPKLTASEAREVPWKFRVMLREVRNLGAVLPNEPTTLSIQAVGEALCGLARKGKAGMLLFWARPFLAWLRREHDLSRQALSPPATVVREFFAAQYGVSEETIGNLLPKKPVSSPDRQDMRRRELLADIGTAMGSEPHMPTVNILERLPELRRQWNGLAPRKLASLLKPLDVTPKQWRVGDRVVRGYRRADLGIYSAEEASREFGITLQGLKQWIHLHKIPVPPLVSRAGVRGRGSVRIWTRGDIEAAKKLISIQPKTVFRIPPSVTGTPLRPQV